MFKVSFCFPSSLQNGNHHPALDVGSEENGKIHPLNRKPNIHLPAQAEKTSSRTSAPHLRSMTIICMLMCKIFQGLEPPHPCLLAGHQGERRGCSFSLGAPQVTNSRLQRQGIVIQVSRIARTSITTGQKRRRFSLIILPKSCSNSRPKQLSQGISEHTGTFTGMEFLPFSVWSQVLKICKSVYY